MATLRDMLERDRLEHRAARLEHVISALRRHDNGHPTPGRRAAVAASLEQDVGRIRARLRRLSKL